MGTGLLQIGPGRRTLLIVAAPAEAGAVLAGLGRPGETPSVWTLTPVNERFDLVLSGVGKANAAGAVARTLDPRRHGAAINLGVAGSLPGPCPPSIGGLVVATASILADDGVATPDGFITQAMLGFPPADPPGMDFPGDAELLHALRDAGGALSRVATVSTCSGTDALALEVACRTGAVAEAMEGAAAALVAHRLGVPFGEVRAISNTTGDRQSQQWDLHAALDTLRTLAVRL
ncbi:MAG TPA: futalosine hydrolase [Phycisphaerales bacterium]|nr:futalosine hydrolase [Phycisphaerales bacterium]